MEIEQSLRTLSQALLQLILNDTALQRKQRFSDRELALCEIMSLLTTLSDRALNQVARLVSNLAEKPGFTE